MKFRHVLAGILVFFLFGTGMIPEKAYAGEGSYYVQGNVYEFTGDGKYAYSNGDAEYVTADSSNTAGTFSITGNIEQDTDMNGIPVYNVVSGNISLYYSFDAADFSTEETEWHMIDDKSKQVDEIKLKSNIMMGAAIVQTSLDGQTWTTDTEFTDFFADSGNGNDALYTTKDIQLDNGCYYRLIIVYKQQRKTGEHKVAFMTLDDTEERSFAEIYQFYATDGNTANTLSSASTPRKEISTLTATGTDNTYSKIISMTMDDPHYGWSLGNFVMNGYTTEKGNNVFLKTVGDQVVLWFRLNQNINSLNGDSTLTIADDDDGSDTQFQISKMDFGRGTLIVQYTDYEGHKYDPIIYTNFLAANVSTGADTRVQLFEEGDYAVALDYEIKNNPRQIGAISVMPTYTHYRIAFNFSIRNGDCEGFLFDNATGGEISNNAVAPEGFTINLARSRYLDITVNRSTVKVGSDGSISLDSRVNQVCEDGKSYTDEGVYTINTINEAAGLNTEKTIYVGSNKYLLALANNNLTVDQLNEMIRNGAEVLDDGSIHQQTNRKK